MMERLPDRNIPEELLCSGRRGADLKKIEEEIVTMPNYFADYDTVHFISRRELLRDHTGIPLAAS